MLYIQLINKYIVRPQQFYWANPAYRKLILCMWFGKHEEKKAHPGLVQSLGRMLLTGMEFKGLWWVKADPLAADIRVNKSCDLLHLLPAAEKPKLPWQSMFSRLESYCPRSTILPLSKATKMAKWDDSWSSTQKRSFWNFRKPTQIL